eukprot:CFRG4352T1
MIYLCGKYTAAFKFFEVYFNEAGKKVFGLNINDVKVIENMNIIAKVAAFAAYDLIVSFKIRDDYVYNETKTSRPTFPNSRRHRRISHPILSTESSTVTTWGVVDRLMDVYYYRRSKSRRVTLSTPRTFSIIFSVYLMR